MRIQFQSAAAECGITCLAMILGYFQCRVDVGDLRRRWPVSVRGTTFTQLARMAHTAGLSSRTLRVEMQELGQLRTPCILHWGFDHFVVLARTTRRHALIFDPAAGIRKLPRATVAKMFTGAAMELVPSEGFVQRRHRASLTFRDFFRNSRGFGGTIVRLLGLSCALQVFTLAAPFYTQLIVDDIVINGDLDLLLLAAIAFGALAIASAVTAALRSWTIVYAGSMLNFGWSTSLFEHLLHLPYEYFEKRHIGDIQSRFGSLNAIRELLTTQVVEAVIDGLMAITTAAVMYIYSPTLFAIVVVSLLLYCLVQFLLFDPARTASLEAIAMTAERDTFFLESIRGILAIKNFGNEAGRTTRFSNHVADSVTAHARVGHFRVWSEFSTSAIFGMQNVLVILLAARTIIDDAMTVGMMIAFIAYKSHFTTRGAGLVDKFFQFRLARIHLGRLEDIVDAKTELEIAGRRSNEPVVARKLSGGIEVRDLWYRYGDNENYILSGIDFDIRPGEHVAITGPSGTGKTTLLKLLVGLSKPDRGSIRVDGIAAHGLAGFRDQVGIVMQNDFLLGGSLLDNVTFFAAEPDIAWAETLCRMAGIHDEMSAMPMGYRTLVGDMGDVLSGGQKQRLLLARALYRKPKILFLDEATSHLDPLHERQLVERIAGLRITRVVIAHREETIRHADRVIDLGSLNRGA